MWGAMAGQPHCMLQALHFSKPCHKSISSAGRETQQSALWHWPLPWEAPGGRKVYFHAVSNMHKLETCSHQESGR